MAENLVIEVEQRESTKSSAARRLRRLNEKVPGVVYGAEIESFSIAVDTPTLAKAMQEEAFFSQILRLRMGKKEQQVVVRDMQRHPATNKVIHIDFMRISEDREMQVAIPIHYLNESECAGVRLGGGTITHNIIEVDISCLPRDLPEYVEVDMEHIELGTTIHLSDLDMPEGVVIPALAQGSDHDIPVVSVHLPRGGLEEEEEELEEGLEGLGEELAEGAEPTVDAEASGESEEQ